MISFGFSGSFIEFYWVICEFLIWGWWLFGIDLVYGSIGRGYIKNLNCFGIFIGVDLVLFDGRKFIGSV